MSSRPLDAKPLFHSGVAPLRKRGFPFFCRPHARHGWAHRVIPRAAPTHPSNPIGAVRIRAQGAAREGDRAESTAPERRARDRGQCSAAAPPRSVRPASVERRGAARRRWISWDPAALRNDEFHRPVPVMSNHSHLLVGSITYYVYSMFFTSFLRIFAN